ncbi:GNAT family N-acetyltransferase [Xylanimonas oleitrophica]|uniref:GNAT family N-acetyltransferase n=1 Tax=Xylanimonas oleitrophica TaxID=2607479 RepID=A0A2W5WQF3_9MICO|nr:GNAT family N-acetyltransferase [Xylanimonas oleitrophica]PZR53182.1 GNAT family N-acetyltransferase [Xylanimonas oleitrophica]
MTYTVRRVRADEWQAVKALRLQALADPDAHLAFLESYEDGVGHPDDYWRGRASGSADGGTAAQYVAADEDGRWVGSATGLLEEAGTQDWEGNAVEQRQVHMVGVWLHPDHRGRGLMQRLADAVVTWGAEQGVERVRLYVHADNARAQGAYRKAGFAPSGESFTGKVGAELEMVRALA